MSIHEYEIEWRDYEDRICRNRFHAANDYDAEDIAHDLAGISAASWRELKEDGIALTPTSTRYRQPAQSVSRRESVAVLELIAAEGAPARHIRLKAILPSYVSRTSRRTSQNPFRDVSKLRTEEDTAILRFERALYQYKTER